jgi:hypothetical protein
MQRAILLFMACWSSGLIIASAHAMGLTTQLQTTACEAKAVVSKADEPRAARQRLPGSELARGTRDVAWAWLASATARYPHASMGSNLHAGSVHVIDASTQREVSLKLPVHRVYEDLRVRLVDLDADGKDEMVLIEADVERGAALVVLGLRSGQLVELARSAFVGLPFRWLNPVGFADFDADGRTDVAAIITPHIGGTLVLYHYRPPRLEPFARTMDVSNHIMGDPELDLATIVTSPGQRPTIIVPDMTLRALHALRWVSDAQGQGMWKELADLKPLPARAVRITPVPAGENKGACVTLSNGRALRVSLHE